MKEAGDICPIEEIIHEAFHELADKYEIDVDIIAAIIADYDTLVSPHLEIRLGAQEIFGSN